MTDDDIAAYMREYKEVAYNLAKYKIGEEVAIAQPYKDVFSVCRGIPNEHKGVSNKMFVRADLMPHTIRIIDIKIERLQDISDEDCLKEGIYYYETGGIVRGYPFAAPFYYTFPNAVRNGNPIHWTTPREAFAALIDKVSGRGTWESNPWVFAYSFELIK